MSDLLLEFYSEEMPASIEIEKKTNPFIRCDLLSENSDLVEKLGLNNPSDIEIFKYIREWKDSI